MPAAPFIMNQMFAFVSVHPDGSEGLVAQSINGTLMPFVGGDMKRVDDLMPLAKDLARQTGRRIKLKKFECISERAI